MIRRQVAVGRVLRPVEAEARVPGRPSPAAASRSASEMRSANMRSGALVAQVTISRLRRGTRPEPRRRAVPGPVRKTTSAASPRGSRRSGPAGTGGAFSSPPHPPPGARLPAVLLRPVVGDVEAVSPEEEPRAPRDQPFGPAAAAGTGSPGPVAHPLEDLESAARTRGIDTRRWAWRGAGSGCPFGQLASVCRNKNNTGAESAPPCVSTRMVVRPPDAPERVADLPQGDPALHGLDQHGEHVVVTAGGSAYVIQRRGHRPRVAPRPERRQRRSLPRLQLPEVGPGGRLVRFPGRM